MYLNQGGEILTIQGIECHLPPVPDKHLIQGYGLPKKEQKWRRTELPTFSAKEIDIWDNTDYQATDRLSWEEAWRQEQIKITGCDPMDLDRQNNPRRVSGVQPEPEYFSESMEAFRTQEFHRLLNGHWVMINGRPIYLTGPHYFYLNYFHLDSGYPLFRWSDCEFFYMAEVARHPLSPHCGLLYVTRRGSGKSFKSGALVYYTAITRRRAHCGIQSKDDASAETLFKTKVLQPMTMLPEFLVPYNPHTGDLSQVKKLEFAPPAKKSIDAKLYNKIKKDALYSFVDYRSSKEFAYDGSTTAILLADEIGKTPETTCDIEKRFNINKFCVFRGPEKKGWQLITSTIESAEAGGKKAHSLWLKSDPKKMANGTTQTGLIRLLCSANQDFFFDEFGFPEEEKANAYHEAELAKLAGDPVAIVGYKQRNPRNEQEAFWFTGQKCIYNAEILLTAKDRILNSHTRPTRKGNFEWKVVDKEVMWVDNDVNPRWEISYFPDKEEANKVKINNGVKTTFSPMYSHKRVIGYDPFAVANLVDEDKGSEAAACVYQTFCFNEDYSNTFIATYTYRPPTPQEATEDVLKAAFFFSAPVLVETNKSDVLYYMKTRGYHWGPQNNDQDFVLSRPESTLKSGQRATDGVYASAGLIEMYTNATAHHIVHHGYKLKFLALIDSFLSFDPTKTKKYDLAVAASLAILAGEKRLAPPAQTTDLTALFKTFNNTGIQSTLN